MTRYLRVDSLDSILIYSLKEVRNPRNGFDQVNDLTIRIENANGSTNDLSKIADVIMTALNNQPTEAWKRFATDFRAMIDAEIEEETRKEQDRLDNAEEWIEAVTSWKEAGKPR